MDKKKRMLVTSALPYANGAIHIGHLVEYLQTDIWVRFQKMLGHECRYMCADDTHGTPVMLSARAQGITPEELVDKMQAEHTRDFADFLIEFDNYYSTNSEENRQFCELIYERLKAKGHIVTRQVEQAYCQEDGMFLPDRMIRGTCPTCGAEDQYGDSCESCSSTYNPTDLKDARCAICGTAPVTRSSEHHFVRLADFEDRLKEWMGEGRVQEQMKKKLLEWFEDGLRDWDISRDAPYFGFKIPGTEDKYFYVWLDAPVGYMAATENWCAAQGRTFDDYWLSPDCEIIHFIGKDIVYFHTLFWPAMLMGADFNPPTAVHVHGFLTVNGQKMSKTRGTFISARHYLEYLDPEYLRYYYACKLSARVEDIDLNLEDFTRRVNADVGNQFVNLGSRAIQFLHKRLDGRLGTLDRAGEDLLDSIEEGAGEVAALYEAREFSRAMKTICALAHTANQYFANSAPWALIKEDPEQARSVLTAAVNAFAKLNVLLAPVLPGLTAKIEEILGRTEVTFETAFERITSRPLSPFQPVFAKVAESVVREMVESQQNPEEAAFDYEVDELAEEVDFDGFVKVDLRVATVMEATGVKKADKLLKLLIDLGPLGTRTIFAGIKKTHSPESLVGRQIIVVANLKPRKMRFGVSEGMLLAAGDEEEIYVALLEDGARPGQRIG